MNKNSLLFSKPSFVVASTDCVWEFPRDELKRDSNGLIEAIRKKVFKKALSRERIKSKNLKLAKQNRNFLMLFR